MDKDLLKSLERRLNLTDLEPEQEEDILTDEEKQQAIDWERKRAREHRKSKYMLMGLPEADAIIRADREDLELNYEEILARANSNKHYGKWQQKRREEEKRQEIEKIEQLRQTWSAKNIYRLMQWTSEEEFGKKLIVTEGNKHFITALCYFLSRDSKFETELGYSLNKGLLIRGISGLGKTYLVRCAEKNQYNPILTLSMLEITDQVKQEGEYFIELGKNKIIYLDDVGTEEPVVKHYGTNVSFFKNFIESYYLRNRTYNKLMISTNNSFSELEEKYGFRVRSRAKDIFNVIDVTGTDMRG